MQNDKSDKLTVISQFVNGPALFFLFAKFSHSAPGYCFSYMSILVPKFALPNPPTHVKYLLDNLSQWHQSQTRNLVKMIPLQRPHATHPYKHREADVAFVQVCPCLHFEGPVNMHHLTHLSHRDTRVRQTLEV